MICNYLVSITLLGFLFVSCNNSSETSSSLDNKKDTILIDIPRYENGNVVYAYLASRDAAAQLNLDSLELGYDSIQIRIWYGFKKTDTGQVFILKNCLGRWSAEGIYIKYNIEKKYYTSILSDTITKVVYKYNNWGMLTQELFSLKIAQLEDMEYIVGYNNNEGFNGNGCCVEVATKKIYRFYGYASPTLFREKYWQADNMSKIIELIQKEFDFKPLYPL